MVYPNDFGLRRCRLRLRMGFDSLLPVLENGEEPRSLRCARPEFDGLNVPVVTLVNETARLQTLLSDDEHGMLQRVGHGDLDLIPWGWHRDIAQGSLRRVTAQLYPIRNEHPLERDHDRACAFVQQFLDMAERLDRCELASTNRTRVNPLVAQRPFDGTDEDFLLSRRGSPDAHEDIDGHVASVYPDSQPMPPRRVAFEAVGIPELGRSK